MSINSAAAGEVITASTQFLDEDDNPVTNMKLPVSYKVYDQNRHLVYDSTGVQDGVDPSLFTTTFTLPSSAIPTGAGERYSIHWVGVTTTNITFHQKELFELTNAGDAPESVYPKDVVVVPGQPFFDQIKIKNVSPQPTVTYSIIDERGTVIATGNPQMTVVGDCAVYTCVFTQAIPVPTGVQQHYMGNWVLTGGLAVAPEVEGHPVYVLTPVVQTISHAIYKMLAKGILENVEPFLSWSAGEYAHHVTKGFEYINGLPPRVTAFTIAGPLPAGMTHYLELAAMVSALREQLFAYQSAWEFQGLGTQLTVSRAESINSMISTLQTDLDKASDIKKNWLYSGSPSGNAAAGAGSKMPLSASRITLGPSTNFAAPNIPFDGIVSSSYLLTGGGRGTTSGGRRL